MWFVPIGTEFYCTVYCVFYAEGFQHQLEKITPDTHTHTVEWATVDDLQMKCSPCADAELDGIRHCALPSALKANPLTHSPLTNERYHVTSQQQHSQLWPFNVLQLRPIPPHLLLLPKTCPITSAICCALPLLATPSGMFCYTEYSFRQTGLLGSHLVSVLRQLSNLGLGCAVTSCSVCLLFGVLWLTMCESYLSTWSRFPDTPRPPMV